MIRLAAACALLSACLVSSAFAADTQIHAEYTATLDRLSPNPRPGIPMRQSFDVTLSGANSVTESSARNSGQASDNYKGMRVLGQNSSDGGFLKWKVAGQNRLQRVVTYPNNVTTMTIAVSGSSCTFNVDFSLKPGASEFMFKMIQGGGMGKFSQPRVQSTSCTIR